jgi:hypothetical protein
MGHRPKRLTVFSQDTGQTQVMVPVLQRLADRPDEVALDIIGHRHAVPVWKDSGLPFRDAAAVLPAPVTREAARTYLRASAPDLVMTGATHPWDVTGDPSTLNVLLAAKEEGTRTLALLDHWQGLDRFGDEAGRGDAYAPAFLGVMDHWTRNQLAVSLPDTRIEVVGHPHLERVWLRSAEVGREGRRARCRETYGIAGDECLWVVVSQLLVERDDPGRRVTLLETVAESRRFADWIGSLAADFQRLTGRRVRLVVRRHDKEPRPVGAEALTSHRLATSTTVEVLLAADLLIGWDSMMLIEGAICGVPVLCLRHEAERYRRVDMERLGLRAWDPDRDAVLAGLVAGAFRHRPSEGMDPLLSVVRNAGDRAGALVRAALSDTPAAALDEL